jgi:predicted nucleotidyltransferase
MPGHHGKTMPKDEVIDRLRRHADEIRARGATSLFLFGSTGRDEALPASDVDLFIDHNDPRFSLIELLVLKDYLEQVLHRPADVTTRDSLHPLLRERILAEAERVF